jgi:hypothetical protein
MVNYMLYTRCLTPWRRNLLNQLDRNVTEPGVVLRYSGKVKYTSVQSVHINKLQGTYNLPSGILLNQML